MPMVCIFGAGSSSQGTGCSMSICIRFFYPMRWVYHDHRYASLSFVLKGQMVECIDPDRVRIVKPWRFYYRSSTMMHFLTLFGEKPVWTLFIVGPEVKRWGFMTERGWVENKEYLRER